MPDPFIIAEIAQGYEGKRAQAAALVAAAADAGADAAKLQLVYADELATPDYEHFALFRRLEMPDQVWGDLANLARDRNMQLQLDVFGFRSLALAESIGAHAVKIHSTDMSNPGLLEQVGRSRIPEVLLSAGGCLDAEIERALDGLPGKSLVLLHGFQGYPTQVEANQILRLREFARRYGKRPQLRLGFADHAEPESVNSLLLPALALGAGATVIEKHLTLAKTMKLEDHESALNPDEFAAFVSSMRECCSALTGGAQGPAYVSADFGMHESERRYRDKTRKHVVAARALAPGAVIKATDVALKRTASAEFVQDADAVVGHRLKKGARADEAIRPDMIEVAR